MRREALRYAQSRREPAKIGESPEGFAKLFEGNFFGKKFLRYLAIYENQRNISNIVTILQLHLTLLSSIYMCTHFSIFERLIVIELV